MQKNTFKKYLTPCIVEVYPLTIPYCAALNGGGGAARTPKTLPYLRPKSALFPTLFMT